MQINGVSIPTESVRKGSKAFIRVLSCRSRAPPEVNLQEAAQMDNWPLSAEVDFSIRVLGTYLAAGIFETLWNFVPDAALSQLKFGAGSLPELRMIQGVWCPSDRTMAPEQLSPAALYYTSSLRRSNLSRDHRQCYTEMCRASQVDSRTHGNVHA